MGARIFDQFLGSKVSGGGFVLRNMPVLAEGTGEVTAVGSYRKDIRTGLKMIKGFLLDRIETQGYGFGVFSSIKNAVRIGPDSAYSFFGRAYYAFEGAQEAFDGPIVTFFVKSGFDKFHGV
jgi:hypothetical protein